MPREFNRARRVADLIQREVAEMLQREVMDPRLAREVTVSGVDLSPDLAHAKVYVSFLTADEQAVQESLAALARAAGFLRRGLAKRLKLRGVPELRFIQDVAITRGARLDALIEEAMAREQHDGQSQPGEKD